jgi:hypothetical protein
MAMESGQIIPCDDPQKYQKQLQEAERVVPRMNDNGTVDLPNPIERRQTKQIVDDTKIKHPSGASSSHLALRYDLIPREGLAVLAERYTVGVPIHGERNYQQGLADKKFILDRLNHIQEHYQKLIQPRKKDKEYNSSHKNILKAHLGAIMWGCCFLAEVLEDSEGERILINDIINWE